MSEHLFTVNLYNHKHEIFFNTNIICSFCSVNIFCISWEGKIIDNVFLNKILNLEWHWLLLWLWKHWLFQYFGRSYWSFEWWTHWYMHLWHVCQDSQWQQWPDIRGLWSLCWTLLWRLVDWVQLSVSRLNLFMFIDTLFPLNNNIRNCTQWQGRVEEEDWDAKLWIHHSLGSSSWWRT